MHKIDGTGATVSNEFTEGNPGGGVPATQVTDDWLNAVQGELVAIVEAAGITLSKSVNNQALRALREMFGQKYRWAHAPVNAYSDRAAFLAGTFVDMGFVQTYDGNLDRFHQQVSGREDSMMYRVRVNCDNSVSVNVYVTCSVNTVKLYVNGSLANTWTSGSTPTTPYSMSLNQGINRVEFLVINTVGGSNSSIKINNWMDAAGIWWYDAEAF